MIYSAFMQYKGQNLFELKYFSDLPLPWTKIFQHNFSKFWSSKWISKIPEQRAQAHFSKYLNMCSGAHKIKQLRWLDFDIFRKSQGLKKTGTKYILSFQNTVTRLRNSSKSWLLSQEALLRQEAYLHLSYSTVVTKDSYYETGDPARLPAQLAGRWGQRNKNSVRWGKKYFVLAR
jgi:hypothetical protein